MPERDRYELLTILLGLLLVILIVLTLVPAALVWFAGRPAQAAPARAAQSTPTPVVGLPVTPPATSEPEQPPATPLSPTPVPVPSIVVSASDGANVRSGPGLAFDRVGYLAAGAQAPVIGRYADWWQIEYESQPAWIYGDIVTASNVEDVPEVAPPPTPVPPAPTAIPAPAETWEVDEARWIDVDLSDQTLTAYENGVSVRTTLVSSGLPGTPTPTGQFRIWIKFRSDDMEGPGYYIEDVPYVMYFYKGYGLHGVTWHGNFGHPMSHGCVNLPTKEAEWLFNWADVGTLVNVHE
jgi:lipoprotein-anchoring transpeptidase ErfK/SrfK